MPKSISLPDKFDFSHEALSRHGCEFVLSMDRTPTLRTELGGMALTIDLDRVPAHLGLEVASRDGQLLRLVQPALRYRRNIQVGDPVPSELRDGRPSWMPGPARIHAIARRLASGFGNDPLALDAATSQPTGVMAMLDALTRLMKAANPERMATLDPALIAQTTLDLARIDWISRQVAASQQLLGDLARLSQAQPRVSYLELAKGAALKLRDPVKWATRFAFELDAAGASLAASLSGQTARRPAVWERIATLRAFCLDIAPLLDQWHEPVKSTPRPAGDIEFAARFISIRYAQFDPARFVWRELEGWAASSPPGFEDVDMKE